MTRPQRASQSISEPERYVNQYQGIGEWRLCCSRDGHWGYRLVSAETGKDVILSRESYAQAVRALCLTECFYDEHPDVLAREQQDWRVQVAIGKFRSLPWYRRWWAWVVSAW